MNPDAAGHTMNGHRSEAPRYWECLNCGHLTASHAFKTDGETCSACGSGPEGRRPFPGDRLRHLDERVRRYYGDSENEIVVILVATFLETLLEDILQRVMGAHGADVRMQAAVLDNQRAVGQRIGRLFPALTGLEFEDAAEEAGFRDFPHRWRQLRSTRNAFIHDAPFEANAEALDRKAAEKAMDLLDQAYRLFVHINNRFVAGEKRRRRGDQQSR